jgi:dsDNA-specific endonuclease/ATPase MutS2
MEPTSVAKLQSEIEYLRISEEDEVRRILYVLAALVCDYEMMIRANMDMTEQLDLIFAKARLSQYLDGTAPIITTRRIIGIRNGRHPLLDKDTCVPLDFSMNEDVSGVIITGPNTGGKTVAMKTVGLLSVMAQCGLHIPAEEGSIMTMFSSYLCDIGDNQSISENLSTFSAHMKNIIQILGKMDEDSLVIIDELGSGTDPGEGMGLAIAILEELRRSGPMFLVSTHYPQVKDYSTSTDGIISAAMSVDKETLTPRYKMIMGETGESCAIDIAKELGLADHILKEAHDVTYSHYEPKECSHASESNTNKFETKSRTRNSNHDKRRRSSKLIPVQDESQKNESIYDFKMGDSVKIQPNNEIGIVYKPANKQGDVCVQVKGEKLMINHKRVKLHIPAESLYPEGYDMSIIFDSVANRKARNKLDKGNPIGVIEYD